MSWKATAYVKEIFTAPNGEKLTQGEKLLLFVLADYHHTQKEIAWPSVPRMAVEAMMDERTARRTLRKLEEKGILQSVKPEKSGRGSISAYKFLALDKGDNMPPIEKELETGKGGVEMQEGGQKGGVDDTAIRKNGGTGLTVNPSAIAEESSPKKETKTVDPRHIAVRETFKNLWLKHARMCLGSGQPEPTTAPWNGRDAGVLDKVLKDNPKWTEKFIVYCLESYFGSEGINGGDPFHTIAPRLTRYCRGPVDRFNRVKTTRSVSQDDDSGVNEAMRQRSAGRDR